MKDKTTGKNILWATDEYDAISPKSEIEFKEITGGSLMLVRPRITKALDTQKNRTKKRAEVFTPSWVCNQMNNALDDDYLGYAGAFNVEGERAWTTSRPKIRFNEGTSWENYIELTKLEITCGEAPFVTSRYNPTDGNFIEVEDRIGFLDRKLRVAAENADGDEYRKWSMRSLESSYGYEFQGDNLLIARINVFLTWVEHWEKKLGEKPDKKTAMTAANVIAWNFWQMDGLTGRIPQIQEKDCGQMNFLGFETEGETSEVTTEICRIYDWRRKHKCVFQSPPEFQLFQNKGECIMKKFFAVIGNPPYQEESEKNGRQPPIYNHFMDAVFKIADCVELITPARFLFNAGQTPKAWNEKILNDEHFKVLHYEPEASKIFPNTDIKGGVAITLRNQEKIFGKIGKFVTSDIMQIIVDKINPLCNHYLDEIHFNRSSYRLTKILYQKHPEFNRRVKASEKLSIGSNIFKKFPEIFFDEEFKNKSNSYRRIFGLDETKRCYKFVKKEYIANHENLDKWKIFVAKSNGEGKFGEILSELEIASPNSVSTQTFISFGRFNSKAECESLIKYLKTKFVRALLGICKVTPDNARKEVWKYVPLQDFTSKSDIDWSKSVHEIDLQLYKKYGLSKEERDFIESHVKEMV
ncbi:Eco57I restriction-modification methylase domain-containing protein [Fibrobacter intestinalis]|uniref:Eco57I restriction-modification methylase domain-containing protein n=1 Tax=Fibrobacter sp. NR9 TaxID=1896200 RepID=UPI0013046C71|nr:Eco57I restriction-modification methylase domain-containing protein [Fibrobacter sp. NR9]